MLPQVVYAGPSSSSETYFSSLGYQSPHRTVHVVDHMLDVTIKGSDDVLHLLVSSFSKSDIYMEDLQNAETFLLQPKRLTKMKHRASFMQQLRYDSATSDVELDHVPSADISCACDVPAWVYSLETCTH